MEIKDVLFKTVESVGWGTKKTENFLRNSGECLNLKSIKFPFKKSRERIGDLNTIEKRFIDGDLTILSIDEIKDIY